MPALSTDWDSRSPSGGKVGGHKKGLLDVSLDGAQGQSAHKASYKSPFADLGGAANGVFFGHHQASLWTRAA